MKKAILSLFSFNLVSKFISGIYIILLIQFLSISDYALYTNFQAIYSYVGGFIFTALNFALIKFTAEKLYKTKEKPLDLYSLVIMLNIIIFIPILISAFFFSKELAQMFFANKIYKSSVEYGCLASFGLVISNTVLAIFQAEENYKQYNFFNILRAIFILLGLLIIQAISGLNFNKIALSLFWIQTFLSIIYLYKIFNGEFFKINLKKSYKELFLFISRIRYLLFYFLVYSIFEQSGVFILSRYSNEHQLANFGVAFRYYNLIIILIMTALNVVLLPKFSKASAHHKFLHHKLFAMKWIKNTWWLIFPVIIILYFGKSLYIFVNGSKYEYSYLLFCIFSAGLYFSLIFGPLTNILLGKGDHKYLLFCISLTFILNSIFSILFVEKFGAIAIAISSVIFFNILFHILILINIFYLSRKNKVLSLIDSQNYIAP